MKKLTVPLIQSQRDSRWSAVILGNNSLSQYNIGNYGCLITSLANYLGKTPVDINNIKGLFVTNGGDFIWSQTGLIGLNIIYTSPNYTGPATTQAITKMKTLLDEGRPLLCEIDFNTTTDEEEMHFILIIGYDDSSPTSEEFIAIDPWTGTEISASVYGGVRRMLINFRAYDKILPFYTGEQYYLGIDLNNKESIKVCVATWKDVIDGKYVKKEDSDKLIQAAVLPLKQTLSNKESTISNLNGQIAQLEKDKNMLADELKVCQQAGEVNVELNNKLIQVTQELNQIRLDLEQSRSNWSLKEVAYNKQISLLTTKYNATKSSLKKLLIDYIFGKTI